MELEAELNLLKEENARLKEEEVINFECFFPFFADLKCRRRPKQGVFRAVLI